MIWFLTENYIKENGVINGNVDMTQITPLVQFCAESWIEPMIGNHFFQDLLSKYNAQTLSADETTLVEKIRPAILWRLTAQCCYNLSYTITNKGLLQQNDDNATSVDLQTSQFMYNHYIEHTKLYERNLETYLIANKDLFPEFISELNNDSSIKSSCCGKNNNGYNETLGFIMI